MTLSDGRQAETGGRTGDPPDAGTADADEGKGPGEAGAPERAVDTPGADVRDPTAPPDAFAGEAATPADVALPVVALSAGLLGYWRLDEGAGTTAADASPHAHHAALRQLGGPWVPGRFGRAIDFRDAGWLQVARSPAIDAVSVAISAGAWVYRTASAEWAAVIARQHGTSTQNHFELTLFRDRPAFIINSYLQLDSGAMAAAVVPTNRWVHLAGTYDGATVRLYVDGAEVASKAYRGRIAADTTPVLIGNDANDASGVARFPFMGRVDEAVLYERALSAAEVAALARGDAPLPR